jgi:hypothetical protein
MKLILNNIIDGTNIVSVETENSGGGNMLDFIVLRNGNVLVINDEYVGLYNSKDAFYEGEEQLNGFYLKDGRS